MTTPLSRQTTWFNSFLERSPVYTTPEQGFESGVFTLKTREIFCVNTAQEEFKSATISHVGFVFENNSGKETHDYRVSSSFFKKPG